MKKVNVFLVSLLTLMLSLFCMSGCFKTGTYTATEYKLGSLSYEVDESGNTIELKGDDVAVVSLDLGGVKIDNEGTWKKVDGEYVLTVGGVEYDMEFDGKEMSVDFKIVTIIFSK